MAIYNPLLKNGGRYPYFEAFLQGLIDAGNNVLCFEKFAVELNLREEIPEQYLQKIQKFNPDFFIFINNQFWDISKYFEQPIIIFDVDSPNVYGNIESLKRNQRYKYLCIATSSIQLIKDVLECQKLDVRYVPPFSSIKADTSVEQNINIGFCGSHWLWNDFKQIRNFAAQNPSLEERCAAQKVYNEFLQYPFLTSEELYKKFNLEANNKLIFDNLFSFSTRISGVKRLRYLMELQDLGLEIRGLHWTNPMTPLIAFPELLLCYCGEVVNNLETTQNFYNSAKIGFNCNHIQAQDGFSWRVADILASNACLVTEKAKDLVNLGFNVPMFESPVEARELCLKLLNNENIRKDIVAQCHEIVDKNHRFQNILSVIEDLVNMSLQSTNKGNVEIICTSINTPTELQKHQKITIKNKIRYKVWKHLNKKLKKKGII